ncbi:MAG: HAD hydrolase-like protein [Candidatus Micrarchaeota archaeon]
MFDFDGTIVDLPVDYKRMRKRLKCFFGKFGIKEEFVPLVQTIENILFKLKKTLSKIRLNEVRKEAYAIIDEEEIASLKYAKLIENASFILKQVKQRRIKIAIVSRNGGVCIKKGIKQFKLPKPDVIISRDDTKKLKPSPVQLVLAIRKLKIKSDETIMVGDSSHDKKAAQALKIPFILMINK